MRVIYKPEEEMRVPLKIWGNADLFEDDCIAQMKAACKLPHVFKHIVLMPDGHLGKGISIGAVVPLKGAICPNIVGVDIGCGMTAYRTSLKYNKECATKDFWRDWLGRIDRNIPTGYSHNLLDNCHTRFSEYGIGNSSTMVKVYPFLESSNILFPGYRINILDTIENITAQLGTLGGGNHFIEAQRDESDNIWIMIHSGSRNIGNRIAVYYDDQAKKNMELWKSDHQKDLNWIPVGTSLFDEYKTDMIWAKEFALLNRLIMMNISLEALGITIEQSKIIDTPHNYAAWENHFGKNIMVHRKGAINLYSHKIGIIPGSMGSNSYIVQGKGFPDTYHSASHGAGRNMSRNAAKQNITESEFSKSMENTFTKTSINYIDEAPSAYKNIGEVIEAQNDIFNIIHTLKPIITLKAKD